MAHELALQDLELELLEKDDARSKQDAELREKDYIISVLKARELKQAAAIEDLEEQLANKGGDFDELNATTESLEERIKIKEETIDHLERSHTQTAAAARTSLAKRRAVEEERNELRTRLERLEGVVGELVGVNAVGGAEVGEGAVETGGKRGRELEGDEEELGRSVRTRTSPFNYAA